MNKLSSVDPIELSYAKNQIKISSTVPEPPARNIRKLRKEMVEETDSSKSDKSLRLKAFQFIVLFFSNTSK